MKVKIKKSGEIINIAPFDKIELDKCDSWGVPLQVNYEDVIFLSEDSIDWQSFRREAAKDILCACFSGNIVADVRGAIRYADELIKQLREDEK